MRPFEKKKDRVIILFLDTGDNCRCPMAKGYLTKLLDQQKITYVEIRTAGVMTPSDLKPQAEAVLLLQEEGVDVTRHRSRPVTEKLLNEADLILGMTPFHVQTAHRKCEEARGKTFLLKEYVGAQGRNTQIADPMGGTLEIFKKCFSELRAALQKLVEMPLIQTPDIEIPPPPPPPPPPEETTAAEAEKKKPSTKKPAAKKPAAKKSHEPASAKSVAKAKPKVKVKTKAKAKTKTKGKTGTKPAQKAKAASAKVAVKKAKAEPAKKAATKSKKMKPATKAPAAKKPAGKKPAATKPATKKASSPKKGKK